MRWHFDVNMRVLLHAVPIDTMLASLKKLCNLLTCMSKLGDVSLLMVIVLMSDYITPPIQ